MVKVPFVPLMTLFVAQVSNGDCGAVDRDALDVVQAVRIGYGKGAISKLGRGCRIGTACQTGFVNHIVAALNVARIGGDVRRVVRAVDGDCQGGMTGVAVRILDSVTKVSTDIIGLDFSACTAALLLSST